ncbi:MAG: bifunctional (p)ppGpp synthetase/guanosine-3',5'-bis(diphosphate) 3'-pyrophosphohydrolase [Chloroflexi bacterium]|nr:bifunctional (p)ppGpp synthetase/guanosine-3',5'-bis(diphosphate) 3'-pyrophosphohydrolase [Chloroflexota bacterium]
MKFEDLLEKVREYLPEDKLPFIESGYIFAFKAHDGQVRESGEPFMEHPLETAVIVASLRLDAKCVVAALLHDVVEDSAINLDDIEIKFGAEVAKLVDGVTKLGKLTKHTSEDDPKLKKTEDSAHQVENLRKMFVAMAEDIRVVIIKLADRLHNMRTLRALSQEKQLEIAQETMDIYAPLAHRFGIWQLQWELEDYSLRILYPSEYNNIKHLLAARREEREDYIGKVVQFLKVEFDKDNIKAEITGRPKSISGIYRKIHKYEAEGKEFSDIYDLLAVRILVDEVKDCYNALGIIHSLWRPIPGQFDDYIANPKANMYQSLHTTVMALDGKPLEIQIRTSEMHRIAEYGIAAHWRYKEGGKGDIRFDEKIAWLRQLMEWQRELSVPDFLELVKTDLFSDQVFVYTPNGEIKQLPASSTPLDFAYRVHTQLGHRCIGAKVNGKLVPLSYQLKNGDTIEIMVTKTDKGPSLDWLNPNLGYVKTSQAKSRIKQWFKKQERSIHIVLGKTILEKELRRLGIPLTKLDDVAKLFKFDNLDDCLAAVGCGDLSTQNIELKLSTATQELPVTPVPASSQTQRVDSSIRVMGTGDLLTHIANCCRPIPGDDIIGFVTRTRGITIHRKDCPNIEHEDEKDRLVQVNWGPVTQVYPVTVRIEGEDRAGLLNDLTTVVSEEKINIAEVNTTSNRKGLALLYLTLQVADIKQLTRIVTRLERVIGVFNVSRSGESLGSGPKVNKDGAS